MVVNTKEPEPMEVVGKEGEVSKDAPKTEGGETDEDLELKSKLDELTALLIAKSGDFSKNLATVGVLIRESTTSITAVPKPLKYLTEHYKSLVTLFESLPESGDKQFLADIVSVIAMVAGEGIDVVKYRLMGKGEPVGNWGNEYVKHLTLDVVAAWKEPAAKEEAMSVELMNLVSGIVEYYITHNSEVEACDLLMEIDRFDVLIKLAKAGECQKLCNYLLACVAYAPDPDNIALNKAAMEIYEQFGHEYESFRCAVMLNDVDLIKQKINACKEVNVKKQMALLLGRHQMFLEFEDTEADLQIAELNANTQLHEFFLALARELDIMDPKTPDNVYKVHLEPRNGYHSLNADNTTRLALTAAFVNGFVNTGFGVDKILSDTGEANKFLFKNKEYGLFSAAASQGLIWRWDINKGFSQCDSLLYADNEFVKGGTLLALAIISSGVQDQCDPASAILLEQLKADSTPVRLGATFGMGLAYANSKRETVTTDAEGGVIYELRKVFADVDPASTVEVKCVAALSLGLICVASANSVVAGDLLGYLLEQEENDLYDANFKLVSLAIALIFMGTQDKSEVFVESCKDLKGDFGKMTACLVDCMAYAGTGNVLKIQELLHICSQHPEPEKKDEAPQAPTKKSKKEKAAEIPKTGPKNEYAFYQSVACFGIGLIAMGEEVGSEMCLRMFGHLLKYGDSAVRRAVPIGLAMLSVSNPQIPIMEVLSKFCHDADADVACNSIFSLGIISAGTNNARVVSILRQLAGYYHKNEIALSLVRMSQGLVHLGKGTITLNPFHSSRQLMCPTALAGIVATAFSFLDPKSMALNNRQHYLNYNLVTAMNPRYLITLIEDENDASKLRQINIPVRVGQAVDTVGQAGKQRGITGFQTHTTPVLLAFGEKAELGSDEYLPLSSQLEGLVILKKNPDFEAEEKAEKAK
uniref:26S proteasome non-ATPase regulatory subunit 2 n=1 Tax=Rhabditophanes sp. KR3021 TaxID=114890 RepID=A0AC35TK98_9BILA